MERLLECGMVDTKMVRLLENGLVAAKMVWMLGNRFVVATNWDGCHENGMVARKWYTR